MSPGSSFDETLELTFFQGQDREGEPELDSALDAPHNYGSFHYHPEQATPAGIWREYG